MSWMFEPTQPMGGAAGEAYSNVFAGTGMDPAETLAREAIQNSVDAALPAQANKVRVAFRRVVLTGGDKVRFVESLDLASFSERREALELPPQNSADHLADPSVPLDLLYIEDYETHGLFGDPHDSESHFHRLLFSLGDSAKARSDDATGGSFGFGKAVYSTNSQIRTIVAFSVFEPTAGDDHYARIDGVRLLQ